jgi:hypothetical protein
MGVIGGPKIPNLNGLIFTLKPSSERSFKTYNNLIPYTTWTSGTGSVGVFSQNGSTTENYRITDTDPFGLNSIVWEARPDSTSGPDGGWNTSTFAIDNTKLYRFSTWVRRTVTGNGSFYLGTNGFGSVNGVLLRSNTSSNNTNPYFWVGTPSSSWELVVGHVWPVNSGNGGNHPDSGRWNITNGKFGNISNDFVWRSETTSARHRTYLYYSTNTLTRQQWFNPRVDVIDGTEPSIDDLLNNRVNTIVNLKNKNLNFNRLNGTQFTNEKFGGFILDGVDDKIIIPNETYTPVSISIWLYNNNIIPGNDTPIGGPSTYQTLMSFGGGTPGVNLGGWTGAATNEALHIWSTTTGNKMTYTNQSIPVGYHHFVFNWNGSHYDIWVDGVKQTVYPSTNGHAILVTYTNQPLYIGTDNNSYQFNGKIFSYNMFNTSLSDNQIKTLFNQNKRRYGL